ncbi:hypothetical protein [Megamonas hypermegale]|uniref:hypothetical protein n=1 Tax=Megamonas hypermegale TaxID=158847 RepID=UPI0026EAD76A|nr:hypothetical protein [Megamonas hypermegale]
MEARELLTYAQDAKEIGVGRKINKKYNSNTELHIKFETLDDVGTSVEELIGICIGRLANLNREVPSRETSLAITKLEEALLWLTYRTVDRERRGVEGTKEK